jgi:hypothetical protein
MTAGYRQAYCLLVKIYCTVCFRQTQRYMSVPSHITHPVYVYRVSQEECARLREGVPYVKVYRYNPKHPYPKLNGYGDNRAVYEIMWENSVEADSPQMAIWRMRTASCITKVTNAHSDHVILYWFSNTTMVVRTRLNVALAGADAGFILILKTQHGRFDLDDKAFYAITFYTRERRIKKSHSTLQYAQAAMTVRAMSASFCLQQSIYRPWAHCTMQYRSRQC